MWNRLRVLRRSCLICRFVDLVKAVNAWVRSAFGNVFFFYEVECEFWKREQASRGRSIFIGWERALLRKQVSPQDIGHYCSKSRAVYYWLYNGFLPASLCLWLHIILCRYGYSTQNPHNVLFWKKHTYNKRKKSTCLFSQSSTNQNHVHVRFKFCWLLLL